MVNVLTVCFIVAIASYAIEAVTISPNDKLKLVQIVFRHGIRTPVTLYPTNPYTSSYWNNFGGLSQLMPQGMNQLADFGAYVKSLYSNFLTPKYSTSRVKVRSTDADRTLQSAQAFVSGIYTPKENQTWNQNWLPIPIHSNDRPIDPLFIAEYCNKYLYLKNESHYTGDFAVNKTKYANFIAKMANLSGISDLDLYRIWIIADSWMIADAIGLSTPSWVLNDLPLIKLLNDYTFVVDFITVEMARLTSGAILNELISNINKTVKNQNSVELYLYATHDNYIAGLLRLFNLISPITQPQFASALFFELYQSSNSNEYYIKVFYKNNVNSTITRDLVTIQGCESACNLNKFFQLAASKVLTNVGAECQLPVVTTKKPLTTSKTTQKTTTKKPTTKPTTKKTTTKPTTKKTTTKLTTRKTTTKSTTKKTIG